MPTPNLINREDTLLGVRQGLGEDFGFQSNWLRLALAAVLLVSLLTAIGAYLVLGAVVLLGRLGWPANVTAATPVAALAVAANDEGSALAKAA